MCGIVGYAGSKQAAPILLDGLSRLEYRGYDSAGLCVFSEGELKLAKSKGRLAVLRTKTENGATLPGYLGIGHTRWATHGAPSDENAHPQLSTNGSICIVHNGIIENFLPLKEFLLKQGKTFRSETDTEVIANLLEYYYEQENDLMKAVRLTLGRIEGSYALGILCATPLPKKLLTRLREAKGAAPALNALEPLFVLAVLALGTAFLVDGSFNPFLYFRF